MIPWPTGLPPLSGTIVDPSTVHYLPHWVLRNTWRGMWQLCIDERPVAVAHRSIYWYCLWGWVG